MAKTASTGSCTRHTVREILSFIDSLRSQERRDLFRLIVDRRYRENPYRRAIRFASRALEARYDARKAQRKTVKLKEAFAEGQLRAEVDLLRSRLATAEEKLRLFAVKATHQPKKGTMGLERIETAETYLQLRAKHEKQSSALLALVQHPKEKNKKYAVAYRHSKEFERLRLNVKSLMKTYRNYKEKKAMGQDRQSGK
jgi:hypothetical protein